jgi:hypothetical protein
VRLTRESRAAGLDGTGGLAAMNKVLLKEKAEDVLRHDLLSGERITVSSVVASDPSRWAAALLLPVSLALIAAGLANWFGSLPGTSVIAIALPVLDWALRSFPARCT